MLLADQSHPPELNGFWKPLTSYRASPAKASALTSQPVSSRTSRIAASNGASPVSFDHSCRDVCIYCRFTAPCRYALAESQLPHTCWLLSQRGTVRETLLRMPQRKMRILMRRQRPRRSAAEARQITSRSGSLAELWATPFSSSMWKHRRGDHESSFEI
jgi:hypothetical protein